MRANAASLILTIALLASTGCVCVAQPGAIPPTLQSLAEEVQTHPYLDSSMWLAQAADVTGAASYAEIKQVLPLLIDLSESQSAQQRGNALLLIYGITARQTAGPEKRHQGSVAVDQMVAPYILRLAPRLFDPASFNRGLSLLIFSSLVVIRPAPPALIATAIRALQDPRSTSQMPDTTGKSIDGKAPSIGPEILPIVLSAGASFHRNPATGAIEGSTSPEAQQVVLTFLRRPDQTSESRSESIRTIAMSGVQGTMINAELFRWLDLPDPRVQMSLLEHLAALRLTPEDFAAGTARVRHIANNPTASSDERSLASALLRCWNEHRTNPMCPPPM